VVACSDEGGAAGTKVLDQQTVVAAFTVAMKPCDEANERFSVLTQLEQPDIEAGKAAALAGAETCVAAARQVEAMAVSEPLVLVRKACAEGYAAKGGVLEHAGKLDYTVDDPAGIQELQQRAKDAEAKIQTCLRGLGVQVPGAQGGG
jgi:hypothetical protein